MLPPNTGAILLTSMTTRPADVPPISMSKKHLGLAILLRPRTTVTKLRKMVAVRIFPRELHQSHQTHTHSATERLITLAKHAARAGSISPPYNSAIQSLIKQRFLQLNRLIAIPILHFQCCICISNRARALNDYFYFMSSYKILYSAY